MSTPTVRIAEVLYTYIQKYSTSALNSLSSYVSNKTEGIGEGYIEIPKAKITQIAPTIYYVWNDEVFCTIKTRDIMVKLQKKKWKYTMDTDTLYQLILKKGEQE